MLRFKQFILQEQFLLENRIDFFKKQFKDKIDSTHDEHAELRNSDDIIDHLADKMDPNPKKSYTGWLINQYNAGNFKQEDVPSVRSTLENFEKYKNNLENKDIAGYDLGQLKQAVAPHIGTTSTKAEMKAQLKNAKQKLIYDSPRLNVFHTLGKEANREIYGGGANRGGTGTDWCTAARGYDNKYDEYNAKGNLYQIHAKDENGDEQIYQYQPSSKQFMDRHDVAVNMDSFIKKYPEMKDVIPFKGSHPELPLSHDELTDIIKNGTYTRDTLKHISHPEHMKLMDEGLMKKIQNGTYDRYDLEHAEDNGYLKKHHLDELPNGLMKKIQNGTYDRSDLEHAVNNNYINPDHITALSKAYLQKLKTGNLGLDEYEMNKKLGAVSAAHDKLIKKNSAKILKRSDGINTVKSIVSDLDKNGLIDDDHKSVLKDKLEEHLDDDKHWKFFRDMAEKHGYMTDKGRSIAHMYLANEYLDGKDIGQPAIDAIANNPKSTGAQYYLAVAHMNGKDIGTHAIHAIANNPASSMAHEEWAMAHEAGKYIGQDIIDAIANNPKSTEAHGYLAQAHENGRSIGEANYNKILSYRS